MSLQFSHLVIIEWLRRRHSIPPTFATLSARFGLNTVKQHLPISARTRLTRKGCLRHSARVVLRAYTVLH